MEESQQVNGIYQQYGDVRKTALQLAIDSAPDPSTAESVVERAELFFQFLVRDGGDGDEIPESEK